MSSKIRKRSGHKVDFDMSKIIEAVDKAFSALNKKCPATFRSILNQNINKFKTLASVEKIQDEIESLLLSCGHIDIYKQYAGYRMMRAEQREKSKEKDLMSIVNVEANDITTDNANSNSQSPAGMMMKFAGELAKPFAKQKFLSKEVIKGMDDNYIYVHDLDYFLTRSLTCNQLSINKLLKNGMYAGHGEIRPAKRIETAVIIAAIAMETTQNEQHGGQAIPAFDFYMAPYVRMTYNEEVDKLSEIIEWPEETIKYYKDLEFHDYNDIYEATDDKYLKIILKRTIGRVHQAIESFIHNCNNIHSRGGNQVVFSSINYGTDTSAEGRLVIKETLLCTSEGVGKGATAIFPIHVFKCKAGVNKEPGDPNYDLYKMAWSVTATRFFPNYLNLDASFNKDDRWNPEDPERYEYEVATMGCRTRVFENRFGEKSSIGRGNLSFTSLNLPKMAIDIAIKTGFYIESEDGYIINPDYNGISLESRIELFKDHLKKYADIVARQLYDRYKFQSTALAAQFPLLMSGLWQDSEKLKKSDTIVDVIKHGTLGVGFIGLAEALIMLTGKHHGESDEAQEIGLDIIKYLDSLCKDYSNSYDLNYSTFATPAEGLSGRFTVIDRKEFGLIKNVTDKDYYTNSSHVPVWYKCTPQHKAEIECPYHKYCPGGHIFYVEADADLSKNPEYVDSINKISWANGCGYGSINFTQGRCSECNFQSQDPNLHRFGSICPKCYGEWSTLDRVTGYLGSHYGKQSFGKKAEILDRVVHTK